MTDDRDQTARSAELTDEQEILATLERNGLARDAKAQAPPFRDTCGGYAIEVDPEGSPKIRVQTRRILKVFLETVDSRWGSRGDRHPFDFGDHTLDALFPTRLADDETAAVLRDADLSGVARASEVAARGTALLSLDRDRLGLTPRKGFDPSGYDLPSLECGQVAKALPVLLSLGRNLDALERPVRNAGDGGARKAKKGKKRRRGPRDLEIGLPEPSGLTGLVAGLLGRNRDKPRIRFGQDRATFPRMGLVGDGFEILYNDIREIETAGYGSGKHHIVHTAPGKRRLESVALGSSFDRVRRELEIRAEYAQRNESKNRS